MAAAAHAGLSFEPGLRSVWSTSARPLGLVGSSAVPLAGIMGPASLTGFTPLPVGGVGGFTLTPLDGVVGAALLPGVESPAPTVETARAFSPDEPMTGPGLEKNDSFRPDLDSTCDSCSVNAEDDAVAGPSVQDDSGAPADAAVQLEPGPPPAADQPRPLSLEDLIKNVQNTPGWTHLSYERAAQALVTVREFVCRDQLWQLCQCAGLNFFCAACRNRNKRRLKKLETGGVTSAFLSIDIRQVFELERELEARTAKLTGCEQENRVLQGHVFRLERFQDKQLTNIEFDAHGSQEASGVHQESLERVLGRAETRIEAQDALIGRLEERISQLTFELEKSPLIAARRCTALEKQLVNQQQSYEEEIEAMQGQLFSWQHSCEQLRNQAAVAEGCEVSALDIVQEKDGAIADAKQRAKRFYNKYYYEKGRHGVDLNVGALLAAQFEAEDAGRSFSTKWSQTAALATECCMSATAAATFTAGLLKIVSGHDIRTPARHFFEEQTLIAASIAAEDARAHHGVVRGITADAATVGGVQLQSVYASTFNHSTGKLESFRYPVIELEDGRAETIAAGTKEQVGEDLKTVQARTSDNCRAQKKGYEILVDEKAISGADASCGMHLPPNLGKCAGKTLEERLAAALLAEGEEVSFFKKVAQKGKGGSLLTKIVNTLHLVLANLSDRDGNQSLKPLWEAIVQDCPTVEACGTQHLIMRRERSLLRVYRHLPDILKMLQDCQRINQYVWRQDQVGGRGACGGIKPLLPKHQQFLIDVLSNRAVREYLDTYVLFTSVFLFPLHALLTVSGKTAYDACNDLELFYGIVLRGMDDPRFLFANNYVVRDWRPTAKNCTLQDDDFFGVPNAARAQLAGNDDVELFLRTTFFPLLNMKMVKLNGNQLPGGKYFKDPRLKHVPADQSGVERDFAHLRFRAGQAPGALWGMLDAHAQIKVYATHRGMLLWEQERLFARDNIEKHRKLVQNKTKKRKADAQLSKNVVGHEHRVKVARVENEAADLAAEAQNLTRDLSDEKKFTKPTLKADLLIYKRLALYFQAPNRIMLLFQNYSTVAKPELTRRCRLLEAWFTTQNFPLPRA